MSIIKTKAQQEDLIFNELEQEIVLKEDNKRFKLYWKFKGMNPYKGILKAKDVQTGDIIDLTPWLEPLPPL